MILIFFAKDLIDCKNINKTAKNSAKLKAGKVSKRIMLKLCQWVATVEKSENIREKKRKNPEWEKSDESIFIDGTNAAKDPVSVIEKIIILLKTKRRSSLRMRFNIFSNKPTGGSI